MVTGLTLGELSLGGDVICESAIESFGDESSGIIPGCRGIEFGLRGGLVCTRSPSGLGKAPGVPGGDSDGVRGLNEVLFSNNLILSFTDIYSLQLVMKIREMTIYFLKAN